MYHLIIDGTPKYIKKGSINNYKILDTIGKGGFGIVYKAEKDNKIIALKVIKTRLNNKKFKKYILNEVDILEKISKPNCNMYLSCYYDHSYNQDETSVFIEMEYIKGITLEKYISSLRKKGKKNKEDNEEKINRHLLAITKDIINGINYLHDNNILHNDIKHNNIMITPDLVPTLIDYGSSCIIYDDDFCKTEYRTLKYSAPEILHTRKRTKKSDIWSLGIMLYNLSTGQEPYIFPKNSPKYTIMDQSEINEISADIIENSPEFIMNTNNELLNTIVNKMLIKDPESRITGHEIESLLNKYDKF